MLGLLSRLALVVAVAGVAAAASLPWPANDTFAFPGAPLILEGAWYGEAPDAIRPHIVLSKADQTTSNRRNADSSVTVVAYTVTSYVCIDESTVMFMWKGRTFPSGDEVVSCAVARIDEKKRAYAAYSKTEGKCPDPADLDVNAAFEVNAKADIAGQQTYERVDGVLSGAPVLTCVNSTTPPIKPTPVPTPVDFPAVAPKPLSKFKGAGTATGVQSAPNTLQFTTFDGFYVCIVGVGGNGSTTYSAQDGGPSVVALSGSFLSFDCVPDSSNEYVAGAQHTLVYNNGTDWEQNPAGYHCERGRRIKEKNGTEQLQLMYDFANSNATDCAHMVDELFVANETYVVFKDLPGFATGCTSTSVAARAVATVGALLVAVAALYVF